MVRDGMRKGSLRKWHLSLDLEDELGWHWVVEGGVRKRGRSISTVPKRKEVWHCLETERLWEWSVKVRWSMMRTTSFVCWVIQSLWVLCRFWLCPKNNSKSLLYGERIKGRACGITRQWQNSWRTIIRQWSRWENIVVWTRVERTWEICTLGVKLTGFGD